MTRRSRPLFLWPIIALLAVTASLPADSPSILAPTTYPVLPSLKPATADLDLSTPESACVSHWKTWYATDMDLIRAEFYAVGKEEQTALTVNAAQISVNSRFGLAVIDKFGKDAFASTDVLSAPPDRSVFAAIKWKVDGDWATPIDPPKDCGERQMIRVDGKWLQPVSVWYCTDPRRLAEVVTLTNSQREQVTNIRAGKFKNIYAVTQPVDNQTNVPGIPVPPIPIDPAIPTTMQTVDPFTSQAGGQPTTDPTSQPVTLWMPTTQPCPVLLPGDLPDSNPTTPMGAVAGLTLAIYRGDGKSVVDRLSAENDADKQVVQAFGLFVDENAKLYKSVEINFDQQPYTAEKVAYAALLRIESVAVLQSVGNNDEVVIAPDGKTATAKVRSFDFSAFGGGNFSCDVRFDLVKVGDVWKISAKKLLDRFVTDDTDRAGQLKRLIDLLETTTADQKAFAADVANSKYMSVEQMTTDADEKLESVEAKYDALLPRAK